MKHFCLRSESKLMELAFYAFSQGFETDQVVMQRDKGRGKICLGPTRVGTPEFSSDRDGLPVHFRCNRAADSMFERGHRVLSLKNVCQVSTGPQKRSATSFATLTDIVSRFLRSIASTEPLPDDDEHSSEANLPVSPEMMVSTYRVNVLRPPSDYEGWNLNHLHYRPRDHDFVVTKTGTRWNRKKTCRLRRIRCHWRRLFSASPAINAPRRRRSGRKKG